VIIPQRKAGKLMLGYRWNCCLV